MLTTSKAYYTFNCTKTYTNGVTHKFRARMGTEDKAMAQTDEEDKKAGMTGTWTVDVDYS